VQSAAVAPEHVKHVGSQPFEQVDPDKVYPLMQEEQAEVPAAVQVAQGEVQRAQAF